MKILLATPTYDNTVQVAYMTSILALDRDLRGRIAIEPRFIRATLVDVARNIFASQVINDPAFTHLLFVDADMGFHPGLITKMIAFGAPVVGAMSPGKSFDERRFFEAARKGADFEAARAAALDFVGEGTLVADGNLRRRQVRDGFVRVARAGAGILLIRREALERLRERFPQLWTPPIGTHYGGAPGCQAGVLQCFSPLQVRGVFVSEDMAFSLRWTQGCGGEIWCCASEPITHVGARDYVGRFEDKLSAPG